jgi:hypothetical protein
MCDSCNEIRSCRYVLQISGWNIISFGCMGTRTTRDKWSRVSIVFPNAAETTFGVQMYKDGVLEGTVAYAQSGNSPGNSQFIHHTTIDFGPKVAFGLIRQHSDGGATPLPINVRHFYY